MIIFAKFCSFRYMQIQYNQRHQIHTISCLSFTVTVKEYKKLGLPGVWFLTRQSGFLAICPVKNMMLKRTISCPVFGRPARNFVSWLSAKSLKLLPPAARDFKAKMHQIRFSLGLRSRPCWGSLQRSPRPLSWIWGPTSKGRKRGREGTKGKKGRRGWKERGRAGRGEGRERRGGEGGRGRVSCFSFSADLATLG